MIQAIDSFFVSFCAKYGLGAPDNIKLVACIFASYPLCGLLKRLPTQSTRNAFNILVSLFFLVGVFDLWTGLRTIMISSLGTYGLAKYMKGGAMPWVVFVFVMGHMSINHIHRQIINNPDVVDITSMQMVLCMKLSSFAWNIYDGRQSPSSLSSLQTDRALKAMPTLLDYLGYVFFFPSFMVGPSFDFVEYKRWLDLSMFDIPSPSPSKSSAPHKKRRRIPHSLIPALRRGAEGVFWLILFLKFASWYSTTYALSPAFASLPFWRRLWYMQPLAFSHRLKYYGIWALAEGSCILSGLGFNGYSPKGKLRWDRVKNISAREFELAQNNKALLEAWNKNTNKWLKNYVYVRVAAIVEKGKPGFVSSLVTFGTSAVWHGFYGGYYLAFGTASFIQTLGRYFRRYLRPFFFTPDMSHPTPYKPLYDILSWALTQSTYNYLVQPFIILNVRESLRLWGRLGFYVHVAIAVCLAFFNFGGARWLNKKLKRRAARSGKGEKKVKELDERHKREVREEEREPKSLGMAMPAETSPILE
ncbi:MBOAT-domain-containing protein [Saitoella complicata NRRL Y-17804]|uniref:Lysophospholipid acyltransferase n=1 Tax=Saitoella complicata (strain BCRC 22490 / CBS 7301 / JCM 7358 / NBRC 10748 / NRRL Y-17804) TaxID=698492 RepID=A0A0E9N872_SAICN|nr:MBOAT-domain-containing protein [Saitoella complicata NRRL Y-17804]ODQ55581.1 MBOAT-domain-containing protein [Saitoella complicata NRRL Y-17804]GAO45998.1 hypothetical protein G7K_0243-t1 [Saitoella complicata NRRL Y-17804]